MWKEWILDSSRNIHIVYGLIMETLPLSAVELRRVKVTDFMHIIQDLNEINV